MKALFISRDFTNKFDGGSVVAKRNYSLLQRLTTNMQVDLLMIPAISTIRHFINFIFRNSYGHTSNIEKRIKYLLENKTYDFVFVDGSLYGKYIKQISKYSIPVFCFYHNVEYNYYQEKYRLNKTIRNLLMCNYAKCNEAISTKFATKRIMLNSRDSKELKRLYNREADLIIPLSFEEKELITDNSNPVTPYLLFVGSDFFANIEGMEWFIQFVLPNINIKVKVVGSVCNSLQDKKIENNKLEYVGFVSDLEPYYSKALAVISPIFSGSGLKTKTIEALKYGKTIFGTKEAFEGIEMKFDKRTKLCNTDKEFIDSINHFVSMKPSLFDSYSHQIFLENYTDKVILSKLQDYIKQVCYG